ncbi:hypothetical protein Tco_0481332 [Tanacetum coccineum]
MTYPSTKLYQSASCCAFLHRLILTTAKRSTYLFNLLCTSWSHFQFAPTTKIPLPVISHWKEVKVLTDALITWKPVFNAESGGDNLGDSFSLSEIFAAHKEKIDLFMSLPEELRLSYVYKLVGLSPGLPQVKLTKAELHILGKLALRMIRL